MVNIKKDTLKMSWYGRRVIGGERPWSTLRFFTHLPSSNSTLWVLIEIYLRNQLSKESLIDNTLDVMMRTGVVLKENWEIYLYLFINE